MTIDPLIIHLLLGGKNISENSYRCLIYRPEYKYKSNLHVQADCAIERFRGFWRQLRGRISIGHEPHGTNKKLSYFSFAHKETKIFP
jgi:hypothetical protein